MRISDWSSDVCSSDLVDDGRVRARPQVLQERVMIGNRYGRAMSSRANVVGPEIIDDIDAGAIGHQSAIPKLAGISLPAVVWRLVQHRLAVEADHPQDRQSVV